MKISRDMTLLQPASSIGGTITGATDGPDDIPILYEDEDDAEMGDSNVHTTAVEILHLCAKFHFRDDPTRQVFSNMNLYYRATPKHKRTKSPPYISPDVMIVAGFERLREDLVSYTIGRDGPAPLATMEALSARTAQQRDLDEKVKICARLRVAEYILVDPSGVFLPRRLLLKRLQENGSYRDEQDADGGITSTLGFRVLLDTDGMVRVVHAGTGERYSRPDEVISQAPALREAEEALRIAEDRRREAEAEVQALREQLQQLRALTGGSRG